MLCEILPPRSIKEYIHNQLINIKLHKSRPEHLELVNKKADKNERQKSCDL